MFIINASVETLWFSVSSVWVRWYERQIWPNLTTHSPKSFLTADHDYEFKSMTDLLVYIFDSGFRDSQEQMNFLTVWYHLVQVLEPEIQNMMLYRMKLSIERMFENMHDLTKEYEEFRFKLRGNYQTIALEAYCKKCIVRRNVALHYLNYVKRFILDAKNEIRVKCPICNKKDSIIIPYLF